MSAKRFGCGLVVGKFAPLHRGHQLLLDTALAQSHKLVIVSYTKPEFAGFEPERRRAWFARLYPGVPCCVLEAAELEASGLPMPHNAAAAELHREFVARVCHERLGVLVDAVFTSEDYGEPFAAHLTAYYRKHVAERHEVTHVSVDPTRGRIPISATQIRSALYDHRAWLDRSVYASTIARVALLGPESSGKTTLTLALAEQLRTAQVAEYGRELWLERGGRLDESDLLTIAREQVRREDAALGDGRHVLCCDTSPLTTAIYSQLLFGRVAPELAQLAERRYALLVYCAPDFPFVQDGTRVDTRFQSQQDELTRRELQAKGWPYLVVTGSVSDRVAQVVAALRERCLLPAQPA